MARLSRFGFLAVAVVFHLIYLFSIFDIYFVSPIVHGMQAYSVPESSKKTSGSSFSAPADRLFLFVGDGLRADKAFQSFPDPSPNAPNTLEAQAPRPLAPFLRSRVEEHGTFGVSHTRVPTESRPGHVALIAGLYEDVSAVTTGWKLNPVNFDSVFNRSRHTWSWGSPDILAMFKEGAVEGRVDADMYSEEAEDYTKDATALDTWVFDKVKEMLEAAESNNDLNRALRQDKNVFFLHLLGLDMTGHSYRPYSREYLYNIKVVDEGVEEITSLVNKFYGDDRTAFIFTADHGMSDWGSHGDGHPDNTRTPLIAWGAGVKKPVVTKEIAPGHEDGFSFDWGLDHITRQDVAQADIAPLMSYLVGLEFPTNSVGELPLSYLSADLDEQAEAAFVNARGILEMYQVKEEQKRTREVRYQPFSAFTQVNGTIEERLSGLREIIDAGEYEESISASQELLHLGLDGLRYLQTYDWLFLRALITLGYLGWMAFAVTTVIDLHVLDGKTKTARNPATIVTATTVLASLYSFLMIKNSPFSYYLYAIFPVAFWEEVYAGRKALLQGKEVLLGRRISMEKFLKFSFDTIAAIGVLELLVLSYFRREVYTVCYLAAAIWPLSQGGHFIGKNRFLLVTWAASCVLLSTFTLLPVIKSESSNLILLGGFLMLCIGVLYLLFEQRLLSSFSQEIAFASPERSSLSRNVLGIQIGQIVLAMLVTRSSVASLQAKQGLPLGNQIIGWFVLLTSLSMPFLHGMQPNSHYLHRLVVIFLTFSPTFIILTISYEGLFYFAFCITLVTWVRLEHHIYTFKTNQQALPPSPPPSPKPLNAAISTISKQLSDPTEGQESLGRRYRPLTLADFRICLFFLFLLQSAFFSTGNIASISSFSLDSVYRLIPIFDPFSQGALLVLKIMIPFAVISANLGILNRRLRVAPSSLFMVVMAISDVLTLNFFWLVRDEGSWLEIGTSISHFVVASLLCAFIALLEFLSEVFVAGVEIDEGPKEEKLNGAVEPGSNRTAKDAPRDNEKEADTKETNETNVGGQTVLEREKGDLEDTRQTA
ncbi:Glycosyl phosphatidyl inositol anchor synthesis [Agyrium rufum]|nr:Glycosyl phosphatidyl inositol anchor synthesis [Agyrium rufum]